MEESRIILSEKEMPTVWYNVLADLPRPLDPPLHPATMQPVKLEDLEPIFLKPYRAGSEHQPLHRHSWRSA